MKATLLSSSNFHLQFATMTTEAKLKATVPQMQRSVILNRLGMVTESNANHPHAIDPHVEV